MRAIALNFKPPSIWQLYKEECYINIDGDEEDYKHQAYWACKLLDFINVCADEIILGDISDEVAEVIGNEVFDQIVKDSGCLYVGIDPNDRKIFTDTIKELAKSIYTDIANRGLQVADFRFPRFDPTLIIYILR